MEAKKWVGTTRCDRDSNRTLDMTTTYATEKKTDAELKTDVLAELHYEPSVKATDIGVLVKDGTVTLNGNVTTYGQKWDAVRATKRISGVTAIAGRH